jgi:hypothetical protein
MTRLWLGASVEAAEYVFLLPNEPILSNVGQVDDVPCLIEINGNHWRKIFTIMAKLVVPNLVNWRDFRDGDLFEKVGIAFSVQQLRDYQGIVFVVGNTFRESYPISESTTKVGHKHLAYVSLPYIWCPYLDYRQFPNLLIESLREIILEK